MSTEPGAAHDVKAAQDDLNKMVERSLAPGYQVENPVTNVRGRVELEKHATPEQQLLIEQLRAIEDRLSMIETTAWEVPPSPPTSPLRDPDYKSPFRVGDTARHEKFGTGPVVAIDGPRISVRFHIGTKRVIDSFLTRVG